jgi:hypothetical protein
MSWFVSEPRDATETIAAALEGLMPLGISEATFLRHATARVLAALSPGGGPVLIHNGKLEEVEQVGWACWKAGAKPEPLLLFAENGDLPYAHLRCSPIRWFTTREDAEEWARLHCERRLCLYVGRADGTVVFIEWMNSDDGTEAGQDRQAARGFFGMPVKPGTL